MDDGLRNANALLVAFGKRADDFLATVLQAAALFGQGQCLGKFGGRNVVQACGKAQKSVDAHVAVERRVFRQEPDAGFGQSRLLQQVEVAYFDLSAIRRQRSGEHLQGSAFARAVVSQHAQYLATPQFQRYAIHDQTVVAAAYQIAGGKGEGSGHCCGRGLDRWRWTEYNPIPCAIPKRPAQAKQVAETGKRGAMFAEGEGRGVNS